jgi:protein-S-isoprenylcysteine O-methyltransferase Ste14
MGMEFTPQQIVYGSWILFGIYWLVSAFRAKKTEKRELPAERLGHMIMMAAGYILLFQPNDHWGVLNQRFLPDASRIARLGAGMTLAGVLLAIWARWNLGKNWSAAVTIKQGHQIIRAGPYAYIRHPIYTGMPIAVIGSALTAGEYRGVLAFATILFGFYRKARKEETFLAANFGEPFIAHKRRTGFFLPPFS